MHDFDSSIKIWITNIFSLNKKTSNFPQGKISFAIDLHEILRHRYHHQYSQIIAIHDQVMLNHQVEIEMSSEN
jgi:hypothetical protein